MQKPKGMSGEEVMKEFPEQVSRFGNAVMHRLLYAESGVWSEETDGKPDKDWLEGKEAEFQKWLRSALKSYTAYLMEKMPQHKGSTGRIQDIELRNYNEGQNRMHHDCLAILQQEIENLTEGKV